ncbi:MAG: excinuclease ABC subunit UvrC [Alphaproteobacteria bacterium]|nr:excinuclease ABC subunit UvrC [Alphaproteobacteria bacterium]
MNDVNDAMSPLARGQAVIRRYVAELPGSPGVYRMLSEDGTPLYIGKAKNLKNRVSNYVNVGALNTRLQRMVSQTVAMEFITTRSEAEALLLEANLIRKHVPRYNILLRDDKSFPYIFFSGDHDFARISKHRGAKTKKGKYFGPFVSAGAVDETLALLQKAFLLRPCADTVFKHRSRPCLQYQIKRCSAPCVGKISKEDYAELAAQAQAFLAGKSRQIQDELLAQMQSLSLKMHFEKASVIRDRLRALASVQQQHGLSAAAIGDADVIVLARSNQDVAVQLFAYRGGRNYGNRTWFPAQAAEVSDGEVLSHFIGQYYQTQPIPPTILVSHLIEDAAVLEEALRLHTDHRVDIIHPLRGDKRDVVEQALRNAREALLRHVSMHLSQREALEGVQQLFALEELPSRIEVYDNSHISGTHAVGVMVVAGQSGFLKGEYRKFNIASQTLTPGDDYAMLREVLARRFKHYGSGKDKKPDLLLIDGGAGQLSAARGVFEELGISDLVYVGIAKGEDRNSGREWFFMPGREPFQLPPHDPVLHYLQRLRDEAHRFAIGAHRDRRSRAISRSSLDGIVGIGPTRKKALLHHFGSVRAVSAASVDEMMKVEGISRVMAELIYSHFHGS